MTTEQQHTNGTTATTPNGTTDTTPRERFPAPPTECLPILQTFMETQQRRVNLWKEYNEAMEGHLSSRESLPSHEEQQQQQQDSHYTSDRVSLQDSDLMTRILGLVTSGLLDCSHESRTIALQLNENENPGAGQMASLVNRIQDTENVILRQIVKRDTIRRTAKSEGRQLTSQEEEEVKGLTQEVKQLREEKVQEYVDEIRAEMTDLQAAG